MTSPRVQGDIPRFFESRVIGRRHLLMTYHIHCWEFPHLSKWPLFNRRRTISEDCEIEFVDLECDINAVDENHSVDYLGIETCQFEPETSSDCTVSASDSSFSQQHSQQTRNRHNRVRLRRRRCDVPRIPPKINSLWGQ